MKLDEAMKTLRQAADEMEKRAAEHDSAAREANAHRSNEIDALNRLNEAQKAFAAAVEAVKLAQSNDSDFGQERRRAVRVAA
jgi:hypothetical protein